MMNQVYAFPGRSPLFDRFAIGQQLRADFPNTDFTPLMTDKDREDFYLYAVQEVPPPPFDPATHRLRPADPILVNGKWRQQWQVVELSQEERDIYHQSTHPPRWTDFALGASQDPTIDAWLGALPKSQSLLLAGSLATASLGRPETLLKCLVGLQAAGAMPLAVSSALRQHAITSDLPSDIASIFV